MEVPADFGDNEVVWTLTTNGRTERAYGSLRTDYLLDRQTIATEMGANFGRVRDEWRDNEFPSLRLAVDQPRRARVGEPLRLVAYVGDDGLPSGNYEPPQAEPGKPHPAYTPPRQIVPGNPPGLRFSWMVYRGDASKVNFGPTQLKTWQDTRVYSNSPWSPPYILPPLPPDGRWEIRRDLRRARHVHAARHRRRQRVADHREPDRDRDPLTMDTNFRRRFLGWFMPLALTAAAPAAGQDHRLVAAAAAQDAAAVRALLAAGVDADTPRADGTTALLWAAHRDDLDMVEMLLASRRRRERG